MRKKAILLIILLMLLIAGVARAANKNKGYIVTSDRMEVAKKGRAAVFIGNVKLTKEDVTVMSDRMESHEEEDFLLATGSVHGVDFSGEGEKTEVFCERAEYNRDVSMGVFTGKPRVVKTDVEDESESIDISGDRIEMFKEEKRGSVKGNVVVKQGDISAASDLLDYDSELDRIILSKGEPIIHQSSEDVEAEYTAGRITMLVDDKVIVFEDKFRACIYMKEEGDTEEIQVDMETEQD